MSNMSTIRSVTPAFDAPLRVPLTLVDLANRFGEIPPTRICMSPAPGEATEHDLLNYHDHNDRLFELVDGTLIEKTMGTFESLIAIYIATAIQNYLQVHRIGAAFGSDGQLKLKPGTIRVPDVSFITRERLKRSDFRKVPITSVSPNLAVEVISPSNSQREMANKLAEYFATGTEEVWYVYPDQRELHQFSSPDSVVVLKETDTLTTRVLPEFSLPIASIFIDPLADDVDTAPSTKG
jgi:Uma2 family endonuclease